ncbi:MAG: hypothetical protein QOF23_970 [Solirubrobacterales bacterium]|nr:hypothetical protein [Solirubrobacterales bacterium]
MATTTFLAVILMLASWVLSEISGDGDAAILRSVHEHSGSVTLTGLLQAVGFALLSVPLFYLFRMVRARSPRVRNQLIGLVVVAPLFLALSSGLTIGARHEAANEFVAGNAKSDISAKEANEECVSERKNLGNESFGEEFPAAPGGTALKACEERKIGDSEAENAIGEASLASYVSGFGIAGGLGFVVALFYSCLWAMRTGVLTRFWGSLGMALGVAALLGLILFTLIWFVYFGLLILGAVPGSRPPAWEEGEAVPWPSPGEKAAAELEPSEADPSGEGSDPLDNGDGGPERRKRKQRD